MRLPCYGIFFPVMKRLGVSAPQIHYLLHNNFGGKKRQNGKSKKWILNDMLQTWLLLCCKKFINNHIIVLRSWIFPDYMRVGYMKASQADFSFTLGSKWQFSPFSSSWICGLRKIHFLILDFFAEMFSSVTLAPLFADSSPEQSSLSEFKMQNGTERFYKGQLETYAGHSCFHFPAYSCQVRNCLLSRKDISLSSLSQRKQQYLAYHNWLPSKNAVAFRTPQTSPMVFIFKCCEKHFHIFVGLLRPRDMT